MTTTALATALAADFNRGEVFFDHLAEDVIIEFPYGPTLSLPARIEGKSATQTHLRRVQESGLTLHNPIIQEVTATRFLAEYTGTYRDFNGAAVDVPLIAIIDLDTDGIHRIREYWDTHLLATLTR